MAKTGNRKTKSSAKKAPAWWNSPAMKVTRKVLAGIGKGLLTLGLVLTITGCIVACVLTVYIATAFGGEQNLPDVDTINQHQTSIIMVYDEATGGYVEHQRIQGINRVWVDYQDMPQYLVNAIVSIEDERFHEHYGVDWKRTVLAVVNMVIKYNPTDFGGSTITQQLVKNLTGDDDHSIQRKVREILTAIELESKYTKQDILQAYLNILPLTGDIEGVGAGAQYYFAKDVKDLTLAECAALASITNNPAKYNPYTHPKELQRRQRTVLKKMYELGFITGDEYQQAVGEELYFKQGFDRLSVYDYYDDMLIDEVTQSLMLSYGYSETEARNLVLYGGLTIYSCERPDQQEKAEAVYADDANFPAKLENDEVQPQAAIYVMDYSGRCVAVVGGRGEKTANRVLNRAVNSVRQPGSVMKPIGVYAPAVQLNLINFSSQIADAPIELPDGKLWPSNYNQSKPTDSGMTLVDYAVQSSKNTVAAQIMEVLTPQRAYDFVTQQLRLTTLVKDDGKGNTDIDRAPMALGGVTNGLCIKEVAAAYQVFGNGGTYYKPYCFTKVMRGDQVLLENKVTSFRVLDTDTAYVMNRLLQNVVQGSNGATAGALKTQFPEWEIFAKTGTTQQNNDVWLVAGTPKYVAASWFGYDMNQQLTSKQTSAARNLWIKVMQALHEGDEPMNFDAYAGTTVEALFCAETGLLATDECEKTKVGVYKPDFLPEECTCGKPVEEPPALLPEEGGEITTTTTVTGTTTTTTTTAA